MITLTSSGSMAGILPALSTIIAPAIAETGQVNISFIKQWLYSQNCSNGRKYLVLIGLGESSKTHLLQVWEPSLQHFVLATP